jgi:hypothetical protein
MVLIIYHSGMLSIGYFSGGPLYVYFMKLQDYLYKEVTSTHVFTKLVNAVTI